MLTTFDLLHAGSCPGRRGMSGCAICWSGCAPDCAVTFFCFAKRKSPKFTQWGFAHFAKRSYANTKRRAGFVARRSAPVRCVARPGRGLAKLVSLRQRQPLSAPACATRLLITAFKPKAEQPDDAPRRVTVVSAFWSSPIEAGLSSAAARGSGRALSERSEFSPTPLDASSARHREAALTLGSPSFAYFSWRSKKSESPAGARPGLAAHQ